MCFILRNNMYGLGVGFWMVSEILSLIWTGWGGANPKETPGWYHWMSYKEQEYIWFRCWDMNDFWDIRLFMKWISVPFPPEDHWSVSMIASNYAYGLVVVFWTVPEILNFIWIAADMAYPWGTHSRCLWMCHQKEQIYGLGEGIWTFFEI